MKITPNKKWIYTYDYAPAQKWDSWRDTTILSNWIDRECAQVNERIQKVSSRSTLRFALLTDTHYVINGTWEDTAGSLATLHNMAGFDGVIHIGDLTDGMLPAEQTRAFERVIIGDMKSLGAPVYIVPGNHDYNYFKGNPDLIYPDKPQYYVDCCAEKLRLIFIDSFDPKEQVRYGFSNYCIHWLESVLHSLPDEYGAIIFSHIPPLVRLQAWANEIRNRESLMEVMTQYANHILAFINGHNHCDHLFNDLHNGKFPIISINCAKCEYFLEHKPDGAVVPYRELGNRTQESFDVMTVDVSKKEIYFARFGAGNDRIVRNGKAVWA